MVPFSRVEGSILVLEDNYVHLNVAMVANAMCFISGLEKYECDKRAQIQLSVFQ